MSRTKSLSEITIGIFLVANFFCVAQAQAKESQAITRTIKFPEKSVGSVFITTNEIDSGRDIFRKARRVGAAAGTVKVTVNSNETVLVDLNPDVFAHPELLQGVSEHGIDRLRFAYCSMDDNSAIHCDDALKQLPHFKDLISIDLDRSDATDAGLMYASGMSKLVSVSAFASDVKGKSFKALQSCPKLADIETDHCLLEPKTLIDLAAIKGLTSLKIRQTNLDDTTLPIIARCSALTFLDISTNAKITDKSIASLKALKRLKRLEIKETKVTVEGLKALKGLPLEAIVLPSTLSSGENQALIRQIFPKATIVGSRNRVVSSEEKHMFAPLR